MVSAGAVGTYEPIHVLKPVADDVWLVDGPVIRFKGVPFPTRMTVVRLTGGGLFLHSPVAVDEALCAALDELGPVRHLVSPNAIHYWWIGDWGLRYPQARRWASPGVRPAAARRGLKFDADLGDGPAPQWAADMDQIIVRGSRFLEEVVFFHRRSRTLILADLIENFEASRVSSRLLRVLLRWAGNLDPDGKLPVDLRLSYLGRHGRLREAVDTMRRWAPERIILAHGRWYPANGGAELERAFRWVR